MRDTVCIDVEATAADTKSIGSKLNSADGNLRALSISSLS